MENTHLLMWVKVEEGVPAFFEMATHGDQEDALEVLKSKKNQFLFGQVLGLDGKVFANVVGNNAVSTPACA